MLTRLAGFSSSIRQLLGGIVALFVTANPLAAAVPVAPYFNGNFPVRAPDPTGWITRNAFPNLTFTDPLWMQEIPGSTELLVLEKGGKIYRFPNAEGVIPEQRTVVVDIADRLQIADEIGLLRIAFHPKFGQASSPFGNDVFLCYSHRPPGTIASTQTSMWRISRFKWLPASGTIDPASEQVLIQQFDPNGWHNGGGLAFDNDGYLLITCGDGGGANGSFGLAQQLNNGFFAGVLRIDVDNDPSRSHAIRRQPRSHPLKPGNYPASSSQGYGIPNDNPWLSTTGTRLEELYALGLRSPHSAYYDPVAGEFWIADVGQSRREELNRLAMRANFGWPYREGTLDGPDTPAIPVKLEGIETPPFYSYDRTVGGCIIGGIRYRGQRWSEELGGKLIIADNGKGTLSALTVPSDGTLPVVTLLSADADKATYNGISNLAMDALGNIYAVQLRGLGKNNGFIRILEKESNMPPAPALLSETGLFDDTVSLTPSPILVPYEVASPLWSDGARKRRWIALPNDGTRNNSLEKIGYSKREIGASRRARSL